MLSLAAASHFRYGTVSWKHLSGNKVQFHLMTSWKRSHTQFVGVSEQVDGGKPQIGDVVRVMGMGSVNPPIPSTSTGMKFSTGDGKTFVLQMKVRQMSIEQDWILGDSYIEHTYASPRNGYVSWIAGLEGCCKLENLANNKRGMFFLNTQVDLTTRKWSPVIRMMPELNFLATAPTSEMYIAATDQFGHPDAVLLNNLGQPTEAGKTYLKWSLGSKSDYAGGKGPAGFGLSAAAGSDTQGLFTFQRQPAYEANDLFNAVVVVQAGTTRVNVDFNIRLIRNTDFEMLPIMPLVVPAGQQLGKTAVQTLYVGYPFTHSVGTLGWDPQGSVMFQKWPNRPLSHVNGVFNQLDEYMPGAEFYGMFAPCQQLNGDPGLTCTSAGMFKWTPCLGHTGWHLFCFAGQNPVSGRYTQQHCIDMNVKADPPPVFIPEAKYAKNGQKFDAYMGYKTQIFFGAQDGNPGDFVSLAVIHNKKKEFLPIGSTFENGDCDGQGCATNVAEKVFTWVPDCNQGGHSYEICVEATDGASNSCRGKQQSKSICVTINVKRCLYKADDTQSETLKTVAKCFHTNWLQLWASNVENIHPDDVLKKAGGTVLNVGREYTLKQGETLNHVAGRFGTTLTSLLALNADISSADGVKAGQAICVIPNTCRITL